MKKFGVAAAAVALLFTSACGGGGGRPSEGDISDAIQSGMDQVDSLKASGVKITDEVADCMAKALHGSKVSDEALKAMVDQDKKFKPSKDDEKALTTAAKDFLKCIPGMEDLQKQLEDMDPEKLQEQLDGLTTE